MEGEIERLRTQLSAMASENKRLSEKVRSLEMKIESSEIIIEALVNQQRMNRADGPKRLLPTGDDDHVVKRTATYSYSISPTPTEAHTAVPGLGITEAVGHVPNDSASPRLMAKENAPLAAVALTKEACPVEVLTRQIKAIFHQKPKNIDFKPNHTYKRFVEYAENSYDFSLMNKKVSHSKNPLKLYIETNLEKIVKYILDNLNELSLNQICSTFFLISAEIDYAYKLVIAHDILLEVDVYSKILYIYSALFNNLELQDDEFSAVIKKIMFHQYCIDTDLFSDPDIGEYLEVIRCNQNLQKPEASLWDTLANFVRMAPVFAPVKGAMKVCGEAIEKAFMLRMLCHYLDWDYTYNMFVVGKLFPVLETERPAILAYYAGTLAMNAYRLFGREQSSSSIFQELLCLMGDDSDMSIVCFLVLKQLYEAECMRWLESNQEALTKRGFNVEYLASFLLL